MKRPERFSAKNIFGILLLIFSLVTGYSLIDTHKIAEEVQKQGGLSVVSEDTNAYAYSSANSKQAANDNRPPPNLKADWEHILHGDRTGGGHLHGTGIPCKSEFPADWDEARIKASVTLMAANDNASWRREDNGYIVSEQQEGDLKVRIVINPRNSEIVTSYPLNVQRNPCDR